MSRATALDKLTPPPSQHIFITEVTQLDGTKKQMMSAQSLSDQSVRMNRVWQGEKWEGKQYVTGNCSNSGTLFLLITLSTYGDISYKKMESSVWVKILGFTLGFSMDNQLKALGNYAVAIRRPSFFPKIVLKDPFIVVDAAMRGQEDMVMNILNADPSYLLRKAKVKNSVDIEFEVTPLEAAIIANDVQMVEKMREHFERLTIDLDGNPIDGLAEMHRQIKAIYTRSLQRYCEIQAEKVKALQAQLENLQTADSEALKAVHMQAYSIALESDDLDKIFEALQAQEYVYLSSASNVSSALIAAQVRMQAYLIALKSDDFDKIFKAHKQAQTDNAFDFKPYENAFTFKVRKRAQTDKEFRFKYPDTYGSEYYKAFHVGYHDASNYVYPYAPEAELDDVVALIEAKTPIDTAAVIAHTGVAPTQTDAARAKPFDKLTLVEKLNRFREEFVKHMQREIIFNPEHILAGLRNSRTAWDKLCTDVSNPDSGRHRVLNVQLVGWAQREASEPVKQDIRQGVEYLTENDERRTRPSRFSSLDYRCAVVRNSVIDYSLMDSSIVDGVGYKTVGGPDGCGAWPFSSDKFLKLMSGNNNKLRTLMQRLTHKQDRCPALAF